MLLPLSSDAPVYHRPIATVVVIVLCVLSFFVFPSSDNEELMLEIGAGVHPLQWFSNLFMHAGIMHLLGNMVFLWVFGIIVEGKLGWWAFALVYLGIGGAESAATQVLLHPRHPVYMLGASGAIAGLLAMCLIWAPKNEIHCLLFLRTVPTDIDLSILWFVAFYICMDTIEFAVRGFTISGAMAHLGGTVLGFVVAIVLLKLKLVDCENWDIFAVMQRRQGESKKAARKRRSMMARPLRDLTRLPGDEPKKKKKKGTGKAGGPRGVTSIEDSSAGAIRALRLHLEMAETEAAPAVYKNSRQRHPHWELQERDWLDLIEALTEQGNWGDAAYVMRDYLKDVPEPSPRVRLKLGRC